MENNKELVRSFVAFDLPYHIKEKIYLIVKKYTKRLNFIKIVPIENYHITIKFLGNISTEQIEKIKNVLKKYKKNNDYMLNLNRCNFFSRNNPKVLWLSFNDLEKQIVPIAKSINCDIETIGFEKEKRRFIPHITIGRLKINTKKDMNKVEKLIFNINLEIMNIENFKTTGINLYRSELTPKGAKYTILY